MHGRIVAALLFAGLVTAGQLQDAKVLSHASAINPAPPKAAAAAHPTGTDPPPLVTAIPDEPTEDPKPEPTQPEPAPSQSSSSSKSSSSSSSSSPDTFSSPPAASTPVITNSTTSSSSTAPPRGTDNPGPTPVAPDHGDDLSSSLTTTTDSSRTTSRTSTTSKSITTTRSTSSSTTQRVDESTSKPPPNTTPKPSSSSKTPKPSSPTKTRTTGSPSRSSSSQHSSAPEHSTTPAHESGTADQFRPAPTPNDSSSDVADKEEPSPQVGPADNTKSLPDSRPADSSLLHNKQATALVFTFSALILIGVCGIIFWLCKRRRSRDRHIMLDEKDDIVAFRRANSSASRSSRAAPHRPTSMISVNSSGNTHEGQGWHYLPARFAGIQPIRQPSTLDAAAGQIAQDPFAVHRVVYPDMPQPQTSSPQFALFPDPVPPPPPQRTSFTPTRVPPPRPASLSPEPAAPAASRPRSPESHYDEESVYTGIQRRPYMIERRPERRRLDE